MIMPAPFYPGSPSIPSDKKKLTREEFIEALTQLGKERYHSLHPVSYTHLTLPTTPYV